MIVFEDLLDAIKAAIKNKFYGKFTIIFEAGSITRVIREESLKKL